MACDCADCALHRSILFANLPSDMMARLTCIFHRARYSKNQIIFFDGGSAHHIFVLQSGLVKLMKLYENGKDRIVRIIFPGELFGFEALTDKAYPLTAVTLRNSEICAASPDDLFAFLRQDPEIALGMVRLLIGEVAKARSQVTDMSFKDARMKMATFLLTVVFADTLSLSKSKTVTLPFSRREISEMLELSPETISRTLTAMREEKLIEVHGRRLTIRDQAGLERAAHR